MLLAIDTSVGTSVAIVDRDRGILAERISEDTRRHAELVGDFIVSCLGESGIAASELSGVALGMGPGPFTGLRVGIATGRVFAFARGIPVVPIASHEAVAMREGGRVIIVTRARRNEVYWSSYGEPDADGLPVPERGPNIARIVDGAGVPDEAASAGTGYRLVEASAVSAGSLGMLAERMFALGRPFVADEALYLRPPDAIAPGASKRVST